MAHEYSVLIHDWISKNQNTIKLELEKQTQDQVHQQFYKGRLSALDDIRKHLTDRIDLDTHQYY